VKAPALTTASPFVSFVCFVGTTAAFRLKAVPNDCLSDSNGWPAIPKGNFPVPDDFLPTPEDLLAGTDSR